MKYQRTKKTQVHLYFEDKQMDLMYKKASSMGMTVNEWIKFLVFQKLEVLPNKIIETEKPLKVNNDDEPKTLEEAIARRPFVLPSEWHKQRDLEMKLFLKEELEEKLKKLESDSDINDIVSS